MWLKLLCFLVLVGRQAETFLTTYISDTTKCVADGLWEKVNDGWFVTTGSYMSRCFSCYEKKRKANLNLYEAEFVQGDSSFVKDFKKCKMKEAFARAYFRSFDMVDNWLFLRLTIEDLDLVVDTCDAHTGNIGLGFITVNQFKKGLTERVFRSLPLSLMFLTEMELLKMQIFRKEMNRKTFMKIHCKMAKTLTRDGNVTQAEMVKYWKNYDRRHRAEDLFNKLDYKQVGYLNSTHWTELFNDLNCIRSAGAKPDNQLSHMEFIQIDKIMHNERKYPSDEPWICSKLKR